MCKKSPISRRTIIAVALYKEIQDLRSRCVDLTLEDTEFSDKYNDLCISIKDDVESLDNQVQTLLGQSFLKDIETLVCQPEADDLTPEQFSALL